MFLKNIFQFVKGYVILLLKGRSAERFINICMRRNIKLRNIEKRPDGSISLEVPSRDFSKLRPIARKTKTRVRIIKKCGLRMIFKRYKKRVFYFAFCIIFAAGLALTSRFVLSVEIVGAGEENIDRVRAAAELAGIKPGAYIPALPDGNEIKNIILTNTDNITWAWVYFKGTKAVVEVREGILPPEVEDSSPCDIIALRDGIITGMTVKNGIAFCKENDVVMAGDLLIGGTMSGNEGAYRLEHADGDVYASTWHTQSAQIKLYRDIRTKTGRKRKFTDLEIFSKNIPLYREVSVDFENYSLTQKKRELKWGRDNYIGITATTWVYEEETVERVPLGIEQAVEAAKYKLEEQIAKGLLPGSQLEEEEVDYTKIDDETIEVTVTMRFTEKIGAEAPLVMPEEEGSGL